MYKKYIELGSELEVNISGVMRSSYNKDMHNYQTFIENNCDIDPMDLFDFFDVVIEEMYHCMMTAFDRFNETDQRVIIAKIYLTDAKSEQIRNVYKAPDDDDR